MNLENNKYPMILFQMPFYNAKFQCTVPKLEK